MDGGGDGIEEEGVVLRLPLLNSEIHDITIGETMHTLRLLWPKSGKATLVLRSKTSLNCLKYFFLISKKERGRRGTVQFSPLTN